MKRFKNYSSFLVLFSFFTACQSESIEEVHSTKTTITKTSPLTSEIQRVVMQQTSQDNSIDKSSCLMIKMPYEVTVNDVLIPINSAADYQLVQNNISAFPNDKDVVSIHFPVTIEFNDYTQKIITNPAELDALISNCPMNSGVFGKIECLSINYPIHISVYDSNNQIASSVSISDNKGMYTFITNLAENKYLALDYPISVIDQNGRNITITTNSQFEDTIRMAVDNCMDNINPIPDFMQIITANSWKISYYYHENDRTLNYNGYVFAFNTDYSVSASKSGVIYKGIWFTRLENGHRLFGIKIEYNFLDKLNEEWKVFEFNGAKLHFRTEEGNKENDYLQFEKK